ncbi:penicillin-binding protein [Corynebacterium halotolerans YIM 70093 = DSM 44683]|uniref:Penicillin-binding protein n=1 Tax=Corynebacterium halotolerans YIM 70093 = DSM 44683 TaxID=1121362 RepID=M1NZ17_9CORY|nr:penicillin-binding protein [Corynebacterium halotolerans YIM 70093 = DSM 44683]
MIMVLAVILGLTACTPKPDTPAPVVEDFLAALSERDGETVASLIDTPAPAREIISATYDGLQAEGLEVTPGEITTDGNIATARYTLDWQLPRERNLTYDTAMTLTRSDGEWTVRWQPTLLHPRLGANQHLELRAVPAGKANVISSDGAAILRPGVSYRILVDTDAIDDPRAVADRVASAVNAAHERDDTVAPLDARELAEQFEGAAGVYSVGMVNEHQGPQVAWDLSGVAGVRLNEEAAMVPTDPDFAPDIISRVSGIVADELDGANGWRVTMVNENGAPIDDVEHHAAEPAPSVRISLDHDVQRAAQEAVNMREGMEAMLVAIRPSTGQVLAVAQTEKADARGDLALSGQYPPGSVFKIITAAAGVQDQGLTPGSIVPCPGSMNIYGRVVINYNMFSLGNVPLERAFASSCNTTFADMSTRLEPGQLADMGKQFGLGIDYRIPGLDTVTGTIPEGETPLERTEAGYGQGLNLASPFGFALVSATAAAGRTPVPVLIEGHETIVSEEVPAPDPATIEQLQTMMRATVTSGTARGMQAGGEIYGKTGEAEINEGSHAWFTGFRDDDIAFATLVVLGGGSETSVAITDQFFRTLDEMRAENTLPGEGSGQEPPVAQEAAYAP